MSARKKSSGPGSGKAELYIQPSILLALKHKASYGYELIRKIPDFGFVEGQVPPGMIYRHLRDLEDNGLVASRWETDGTGPAKRMYDLTDEGREILDVWIEVFETLYAIAHPASDGGCTNWFGMWAPGRFYPTHNDFSYMISPRMYREIFLPVLRRQTEYLDYSVYHTDEYPREENKE